MALVKYNNNSISSVTALGSLSSGDLNLLTTNNITSGVSSSSFTSNIDSTYDTYMFKFINMHAANEYDPFQINFSVDGGSNYNVTKTSTALNSYMLETNSSGAIYRSAWDLAQSTSDQIIAQELGNGNDESASGFMYLYEPSSTSKVKHFIGTKL